MDAFFSLQDFQWGLKGAKEHPMDFTTISTGNLFRFSVQAFCFCFVCLMAFLISFGRFSVCLPAKFACVLASLNHIYENKEKLRKNILERPFRSRDFLRVPWKHHQSGINITRTDLHPAVGGGWMDVMATLGHPHHIHVPAGGTSKVISIWLPFLMMMMMMTLQTWRRRLIWHIQLIVLNWHTVVGWIKRINNS